MSHPGVTTTGIRVVLVGSMAAGKSTVGRALAQHLHMPFVDTDTAIERATGASVAALFADRGEAGFRAVERDVCLAELAAPEPRVIAFGGGAFENADVRARCAHDDVLTVWLQVSLDVALERATADPTPRPMLAVADPRARLAALNARRSAAWSTADLILDASDAPVASVVAQIAGALDG